MSDLARLKMSGFAVEVISVRMWSGQEVGSSGRDSEGEAAPWSRERQRFR